VLLKCLQIAHLETKNWPSELISLLTLYRSTPQVTTGATPFSLMFGREMVSKLPELRRETFDVLREATRDRLIQQLERKGLCRQAAKICAPDLLESVIQWYLKLRKQTSSQVIFVL